jgi:hypothetical protein
VSLLSLLPVPEGKHTAMKSKFKDLIQFGAFFIALVFSGMGISHAQSSSGQHSTPWGDSAKNQGANQGGNQSSTPPKAENPPSPVEAVSVEARATPEGDSGSCAYSTPEDETFLCKMIRIFYGPDTPRGPNRDVEENISAGGAGG